MKILFLTQLLPYPLVGGPKIRAYYMLRYLAERHQVTLVSFTRPDDKPEDIAHLQQFCETVHAVPMRRSVFKNGQSALQGLITRQPMVIWRDRLPEMAALIQHLVDVTPFDAVHADQTSMAQYGLLAKKAHPPGKRPFTILDQHNAMYLLVARQAQHERSFLQRRLWQREARAFRKYEKQLCRAYDRILTVTGEDKTALLNLFSVQESRRINARMTPLPICVEPQTQPILPREDQTPQILYLGTMFWPPNVEGALWFANQVLPRVLLKVPQAKFTIAGKNPPPEVEALARVDSPLAGHITITGFVPDAGPLLARSRVFVVPLLAGGGMRVKILDAWQWGIPLVSTSIGAEGIHTQPGKNILLADDPQAFADAVVALLSDVNLARRLRENGRSWVEENYNWRTTYRRLDDIYVQVDRIYHGHKIHEELM